MYAGSVAPLAMPMKYPMIGKTEADRNQHGASDDEFLRLVTFFGAKHSFDQRRIELLSFLDCGPNGSLRLTLGRVLLPHAGYDGHRDEDPKCNAYGKRTIHR